MKFKLKKRLKECSKCKELSYCYSGSENCIDCNNGFNKKGWN